MYKLNEMESGYYKMVHETGKQYTDRTIIPPQRTSRCMTGLDAMRPSRVARWFQGQTGSRTVIALICFISLSSQACANDDVVTFMPKKSISERVSDLEKNNSESRSRETILEERLEMLAEKLGFYWRRQLNYGTWIELKNEKANEK